MNDLLEVTSIIGAKAATFGTSGNASERDRTDPDFFWITPSGIPWDAVDAQNLVQMVSSSGTITAGTSRPSSEWRLHRQVYLQHAWVGGIVHLHSPYATVLSTLGEPIRAVHYQMARVGDEVPVIPYVTFGTEELAEKVRAAIQPTTSSVLLANHGLVAVGETVQEAWRAAEEVEWTAMIQYRASLLGKPQVLDHDQLESVRSAFRGYGQHAGRPERDQ